MENLEKKKKNIVFIFFKWLGLGLTFIVMSIVTLILLILASSYFLDNKEKPKKVIENNISEEELEKIINKQKEIIKRELEVETRTLD